MPTVTITGAAGTNVVSSLQVTTASTAALAQTAANNVSALFTSGFGQVNINGGVSTGALIVGSIGGTTDTNAGSISVLNIPNNVQSLLINNTGATTASNSRFVGNETVIAGTGNLTFTDNGASTTIITGGGTNAITFSANSTNASFTSDGVNTLNVNTSSGATSVFGTSTSSDTIIGTASTTGGITYTSAAGAKAFINPGAANVTVFGAGGAGTETVFGGASVNSFSGKLTVTDGTGYFQGGTAGGNVIGSSTVGSTTLIGGGSGDVLTAKGLSDKLVAGAGAATLDGSSSLGGDFFFASSTGAALMYGSRAIGDTFFTNNSTVAGVGFTGSFIDLHTGPNSQLRGLNNNVSGTVAVGFSGSGANFASVGDFVSGTDKVVLNTSAVGSSFTLANGTVAGAGGSIAYTNLVTSNGSTITFYNATLTNTDIIKI